MAKGQGAPLNCSLFFLSDCIIFVHIFLKKCQKQQHFILLEKHLPMPYSGILFPHKLLFASEDAIDYNSIFKSKAELGRQEK